MSRESWFNCLWLTMTRVTLISGSSKCSNSNHFWAHPSSCLSIFKMSCWLLELMKWASDICIVHCSPHVPLFFFFFFYICFIFYADSSTWTRLHWDEFWYFRIEHRALMYNWTGIEYRRIVLVHISYLRWNFKVALEYNKSLGLSSSTSWCTYIRKRYPIHMPKSL